LVVKWAFVKAVMMVEWMEIEMVVLKVGEWVGRKVDSTVLWKVVQMVVLKVDEMAVMMAVG
jgi:hypothetical protein